MKTSHDQRPGVSVCEKLWNFDFNINGAFVSLAVAALMQQVQRFKTTSSPANNELLNCPELDSVLRNELHRNAPFKNKNFVHLKSGKKQIVIVEGADAAF